MFEGVATRLNVTKPNREFVDPKPSPNELASTGRLHVNNRHQQFATRGSRNNLHE